MVTVYTKNRCKCWNFATFADAREYFYKRFTGDWTARNVFTLNWNL